MKSRRRNGSLVAIALFLGLAGCVAKATVRPLVGEMRSETVAERFPLPGKRTRAFVGDPVLRIKSYAVVARNVGYAQANQSFTFSSAFESVDVEAGKQYPIAGITNLNNQEYFVVLVPAHLGQGLGLLVGGDGALCKTALNMGPIGALGWIAAGPAGQMTKGTIIRLDYAPSTPSARLTPAVTKEVLTSDERGRYVNMELLYLGVSSDAVKLGYREYTPSDLAKPAFREDLTYDRRESSIRFRDFKLQVHEANSDHIDFSIVDDPSEHRER